MRGQPSTRIDFWSLPVGRPALHTHPRTCNDACFHDSMLENKSNTGTSFHEIALKQPLVPKLPEHRERCASVSQASFASEGSSIGRGIGFSSAPLANVSRTACPASALSAAGCASQQLHDRDHRVQEQLNSINNSRTDTSSS